jgi:hypothetical protein
LGTSDTGLSKQSVVAKKALHYQYLLHYTLPNLHRGSMRELTFPLSDLGRLSLKEGYSAGLMRAIYLQDREQYGLLDRIFLNHPLHRGVYHRLQALRRMIETEFHCRLGPASRKQSLRILTAPSGYAFDLLDPLKKISQAHPEKAGAIHILASDFDPDGQIELELSQATRQMRTGFEFVRGDLTSAQIREHFRQAGPYDMILFVGLSAWISKTHLVDHLKLVRHHLLAAGGVLFTDCFTPQVSALSGKYMGYKANYYSPEEFSSLLAYCGFEPADVSWESGPDGVDHVCVARIYE